MKELLVEVGKVGESQSVSYPVDEGHGDLATAENVMEISRSYTENKSKPVKGYASFFTTLAYNLPYGVSGVCSHGREYYSSFDTFVKSKRYHSIPDVAKWETLPKCNAVSIGERLRLLRKELRLTQEEFAQRIGKGVATIKRWESGQTEPNDKTLRLISHTFGVSYEWLKTGEGDMFIKPKPNARLIPEEEIVWVPIVARVGAGYPVDQGDVEVKGHFPVPRHVWESLPKGTYTTEVVGDSMEPTLHEGDVVAAKPYEGSGDDIPNGKVVIVADASGELVVKRLKHINGRPVLTSDNPKYEPIYPNHEHRIIGIAIKAWKGVDL